MRFVERFLPLGGRVLLSLIFLASSYWKIKYWSDQVQMLDLKLLPAPAALLAVALVVELVGALALLVGFKARFAALALFLYLIPVTLIMHGFLGAEGAERPAQMAHFMKNLAIMGGLLTVAAWGAGPYSVDERLEEELEE